jgi:hypothetical protein
MKNVDMVHRNKEMVQRTSTSGTSAKQTPIYNRPSNARLVSDSFGEGTRPFWEKIRAHARGQGIETVNILTDYIPIFSDSRNTDALFQFLSSTRLNMFQTTQNRFIGTAQDREAAFKLVEVFWWQLALLKKLPEVIQSYERDYRIAAQFQQNFDRLPTSVKQYIFTVLLSIFQSVALQSPKIYTTKKKLKKKPHVKQQARHGSSGAVVGLRRRRQLKQSRSGSKSSSSKRSRTLLTKKRRRN